MASTAVASRLARRTVWDELRPILVGLGDNIFQSPKLRRRRSPAAHPPPYIITDDGVPGIIFRKPVLLPLLVISPEHIRFVIGPGAVIDRVHGWDYVCFDRRPGANPFDWRIIVVLLAAAGATAFFFYRTRPRRDDGPGGPGPRGPGPGGRSRFRRSLGLLEVLLVGAGGGDAGGGRIRRSLGLLEVLGGGGGRGGGVEGCSGGGGGTGPQDRESSAELQDSTVDGVVARYSHEFPQEAEVYSSQRCDSIELFLLTECISQVQENWENSMRLMQNVDIPEGDSSEICLKVTGGVVGCSSGGGGTGPQDPESSAELQDSTVDGVLARYSHEFPQEAEAYLSQRCDWIELFLLTECISQVQCNWENSMRLMHSLDFPEGDSSEVYLKVAGGVESCSPGGRGTGPQDPESSAGLKDSGNWEKKCIMLTHHPGSPEGDSSEICLKVLSACDSSAKERAGGHLFPPNVQVFRG